VEHKWAASSTGCWPHIPVIEGGGGRSTCGTFSLHAGEQPERTLETVERLIVQSGNDCICRICERLSASRAEVAAEQEERGWAMQNLINLAQDYDVAREAEPWGTRVHSINGFNSPPRMQIDLEVNGERRRFVLALRAEDVVEVFAPDAGALLVEEDAVFDILAGLYGMKGGVPHTEAERDIIGQAMADAYAKAFRDTKDDGDLGK